MSSNYPTMSSNCPTMSSNYPPGAANDPRAPWNEALPTEVDVCIETTLVKETTLFVDEDDDPEDGWWQEQGRYQASSPADIITECEQIVKALRKEGHSFYAGVDLYSLGQACRGWTEQSYDVEIYSTSQ